MHHDLVGIREVDTGAVIEPTVDCGFRKNMAQGEEADFAIVFFDAVI